MVEVGGRLRFGMEALDVDLVCELAGQDHLQGDPAIQTDLSRLKHDAHATARELAADLVVAEIADVGR
jgi:hypothetical protein